MIKWFKENNISNIETYAEALGLCVVEMGSLQNGSTVYVAHKDDIKVVIVYDKKNKVVTVVYDDANAIDFGSKEVHLAGKFWSLGDLVLPDMLG